MALLLVSVAGCSVLRQGESWRPPRLVVVVVVDQMRSDYLRRFADQYTGGLARLSREGVVFTDAHHDHAITQTAPGHATLATGVYPWKHGIVYNFWWERGLGRTRYAVEDTVAVLGAPDVLGSSSHFLGREPLGSWLKGADSESKVFAVSLKDRAALPMAGPLADAAYWFAGGRFVTSVEYLDAYPEWVTAFNTSALIESYFPSGWDRLYPEAAYGASREDDFPLEADGRHTTFPHLFEGDAPGPEYYSDLWETPFGDELTFTFGRTLLEEEALGADRSPDLLMICASSADPIGHAFGPYSQEVQDYYLRLDQMLESLLEALDAFVGPENYLLTLTSDHGVMPIPEELRRRGVEARRINADSVLRPAVEAARRRLGLDELPVVLAEGPVLKFAPGTLTDAALTAARAALADALRERPEVADAFTGDELADPATEDRPFLEAYRRSFFSGRSADVLIRYREHYLAADSPFGTTHGSPYGYDTHIPLIFMHSWFAPDRHERRVRAVDFAPTLAFLMGINAPDDLDGAVLPEIERATEEAPRVP